MGLRANAMTMLDRALSFRRPHSDADLSYPGESGADESKTKRPHIYLLASNFVSRIGHQWWPCLVIALLFLALLFLISFAFPSTTFVCISRFDPVARIGFFGLDGLESDFGALGVPWCKLALSLSAFDIVHLFIFMIHCGFS